MCDSWLQLVTAGHMPADSSSSLGPITRVLAQNFSPPCAQTPHVPRVLTQSPDQQLWILVLRDLDIPDHHRHLNLE